MLTLEFARQRDSVFRILCLGAHSDDIEIGCGGTILRLLGENPTTEIVWVVFGASGQRRTEAVESASLFLANARRKEIVIKEFRDGYFPYIGAVADSIFLELKRQSSWDPLLTSYP